MRMILRKINSTNTLQNLVEVACNKYDAMEKSRVANILRNSKLAKLREIIQNKKSTALQIATEIKALSDQEDKGTRLKSLLDVLSVCADIQLNKTNFENAYEVLKMQRSKLTNDEQWLAGFHFEKALRNVVIPKALRFVNKIENEVKHGNTETHRHIYKPITQLITPEFITKERRAKRVRLLKHEIADLKDKLSETKKLVVKNRRNEVRALAQLKSEKELSKQLAGFVHYDQKYIAAQRAAIEESLMLLAEKTAELENTKQQFDAQLYETGRLEDTVSHTTGLLQDASELMAAQEKAIDHLADKVDFLSNYATMRTEQLATTEALAEQRLTVQRLQSAKSKYAALDKSKAVIMQQGRQINDLLEKLQITQKAVHISQIMLEVNATMANHEKTALRVNHVKEKKAAADKLLNVIKTQGRELNDLNPERNEDSITLSNASLAASSFFQSPRSPSRQSPFFSPSPKVVNWVSMPSDEVETEYGSDFENDSVKSFSM